MSFRALYDCLSDLTEGHLQWPWPMRPSVVDLNTEIFVNL